jgi:hypothetical protein
LSRPRTTGRLAAPGAKPDEVMPGLDCSTSPSVAPVLRWISALGIAVTVANWSVTIGSVPCSSVPCSGTASSGAGPRWIGLGALTVICGS